MKTVAESKLLAVTLLIIINIISHFMPFERAALAPDDYVALVQTQDINLANLTSLALKHPDRPLNHIVLMVQSKLVGNNPKIGLLLVVFSSTFVLLAVFILLKELLSDQTTAFLGTVLFCLLPYKLETYHTPIYFNINTVIAVYIVSVILFIYFTKTKKKTLLVTSIAAYTVGIFWYEVGFFLPLLLLVYAQLFARDKRKYVLYTSIPLLIYTSYRLTGGFGWGDASSVTQSLNPARIIAMLPVNLMDLLHSYMGRYMARNILYGAYEFVALERTWLILVIFVDVILLAVVAFWLKGRKVGAVSDPLRILAGVVFGCSLIPILLNDMGGVGGRHLVLPSIGVSIFAISLLERTRRHWRVVSLVLMAVGMVVSQGNAWAQVVACRINAAVYETIQAKRAELMQADRIIIDTKSFADKIPFTWVQRDFNVLKTYYGAQAFEDWGLKSMITLATGGTGKPVYIATGSPRVIGQGLLEFAVSEYRGYLSVSKIVEVVPQERTAIINFQSVFGEEFNNGIRKIGQRVGK